MASGPQQLNVAMKVKELITLIEVSVYIMDSTNIQKCNPPMTCLTIATINTASGLYGEKMNTLHKVLAFFFGYEKHRFYISWHEP